MKRESEQKPSRRRTDRAAARVVPAPATADVPRPRAPLSEGEAYLSFVTRPGAEGGTVPIFHGSNPVGDALLSTGIVDLAGGSIASMVPLLPVGTVGLEVREALHRFDANAYPPSLESGAVADNRVGEPMGAVSMRWLLAPDNYDATSSGTPPPTSIQPARSQRFVMLGGRLTFQDRRQGVLRFFGAGRTFPTAVEGRSRLLFAGTATVLEGLGSLQNVRGTLLVSGEVTTQGTIAMTVVARLDPGGPLQAGDVLSPLIDADQHNGGSSRVSDTVFVFAAEGRSVSSEKLRPARIGSDLGSSAQLRSLIRRGAVSGYVAGALTFDTTDRRCGVPLGDSRRVLTVADNAGRRVGTITTGPLEGTGLRDTRGGEPVQRVIASGQLAGGTGAFAGTTGTVTLDTVIDAAGASSSVYVLRLADPTGRFRPQYPEVFKPIAPPAEPVPASADVLAATSSMQFVEHNGTRMTDADRTIVAFADRTLAEGIQVQRWWEEKDKVGDYAERFDVVREFNQDDRSFGFFDRAPIGSRTVPVMGIVQEMFYDRQKLARGEVIRDQLQEFVLRYFMRVSHFRQPEAMAEGQPRPGSTFQRMMSWLPDEAERRVGFGYQQLYYRLADSGKIGKFAEDEQRAIVDLRDVGTTYAWILLKVDIFDFNLSFSPFGSEAMKFQMPLKESTYLVLGPRFITNKVNPEPGVLGEFGYGYAFVPYAPHANGPIAYGPGHFAVAIQSVNFRVMEDGEIRARAAFVVNRPDKIAKIDIDPINWGFQMADVMTFNMASRLMGPLKSMAGRLPLRVSGVDPIAAYIWMANTMTGGMAGKQLGISKEVLEKRMLVQHFMQHYAMLINSLLVWRMVPDWTDHQNLPEFCNKGIRC